MQCPIYWLVDTVNRRNLPDNIMEMLRKIKPKKRSVISISFRGMGIVTFRLSAHIGMNKLKKNLYFP